MYTFDIGERISLSVIFILYSLSPVLCFESTIMHTLTMLHLLITVYMFMEPHLEAGEELICIYKSL